ncbi:TPA: hypothetical protein JG904_004362 [Enterobacter hormaechei subsp. xiangfangensis]|nr:hypothetical protein [Enterobacter hormaechei subsp. xiangfangensis]
MRPVSSRPTYSSLNAQDERWVTDIICIWTFEGRLYFAAAIKMLSRKVIGWSDLSQQ